MTNTKQVIGVSVPPEHQHSELQARAYVIGKLEGDFNAGIFPRTDKRWHELCTNNELSAYAERLQDAFNGKELEGERYISNSVLAAYKHGLQLKRKKGAGLFENIVNYARSTLGSRFSSANPFELSQEGRDPAHVSHICKFNSQHGDIHVTDGYTVVSCNDGTGHFVPDKDQAEEEESSEKPED